MNPALRNLSVIRQARQLMSSTNSAAEAMSLLFQRANVRIRLKGDVFTLQGRDRGLVVASDHRLGVEVAPLYALFGHIKRTDSYVIAKPYSMTARLMSSICGESSPVLPVVPKSLTRNPSSVWNRDLGWRILRFNRLPSAMQAASLNFNTLQRAAELASTGSLVTMFPAGGVVDGLVPPWRAGIAHLLQLVPKTLQDSVEIALVRFDDFSPVQLMRSLLLQSYGVSPAPMELTLRVKMVGSIADVTTGKQMNARHLTENLQQQFRQAFSSDG